MLQAVLFGLFHLYEVFLASAITTQIMVSAAVVALSSAVVYYCQNRAYANYIPFGLMFGGWRAGDRGPGDNQAREAAYDGRTHPDTGDNDGGGRRTSEEPVGAMMTASVASASDHKVAGSQTSCENLPVPSQAADHDNKQVQLRRHGRVQESSDTVRKRVETFERQPEPGQNGQSKEATRETLIREDAVVRRKHQQHSAPVPWADDKTTLQQGTPGEPKMLQQAHLKGKTSEIEDRGQSTLATSAEENVDVALGVSMGARLKTTPSRPSSKETSDRKGRTGLATKPKAKQQSYLDVNEKVKSLHRTTGRISVRSSATTHSHFFLPTENIDPNGKPMMQFAFGGTKVEHRLKTIKAASADSVTKPSHVEKLDSSSGHLRPSAEHTQKETEPGTTNEPIPIQGQSDVRRRSSSPAPIPWIQTFATDTRTPKSRDDKTPTRTHAVFKFTGSSPEKQTKNAEQKPNEERGCNTTNAFTAETIEESMTQDDTEPTPGIVFKGAESIDTEKTDDILPETKTEVGAATTQTDGEREGGTDFGSFVADAHSAGESPRPPVITEKMPLPQLTLPSLEITEAVDEPMAEEPSPTCLTVTRSKRHSLEVPMITTSEMAIPKPVVQPTAIAVTSTEPPETPTDLAATNTQEKIAIPRIQTFEAPEPVDVPNITFDDDTRDIGCGSLGDLGSSSSRESLEVPSVDIDKEAYPARKNSKKPPEIEIPSDATPKIETGQASPSSPTKRKSLILTQDEAEDEDELYDDFFIQEQTKRVKRPRLQRDYGIDIPDWQLTGELFPTSDFGNAAKDNSFQEDVKSRFLNSTNESIMHFFERTRGSNDSSDSEKSELERKIEAVTEKAREADEGEDPDKDNDETQDDAKSRFLEAPKDEQHSHLLLTTAITSSTDSSGGDAISCQQDTDDAKSRFLQPSDAAKSSLLLSKTIRSSIDVVDGMPSQDTIQSVPSVSTVEEADNEEPLSQPDIQGRQDEAAAEAAPSAKSRFLESCVESENEPEDEGQSTIPRQNPQTGRWETGAASWGKLLEAELADDIEFYESDEELEKEPNSRDEYVPETEAQRSDGDEDDDDDVELLGAAAPKPRRRETTAYGTASDIFSPWYNKAVVIDNGSDVLKIGLAGGYIPSITMPTIVGRKRGYDLSERDRHTYIGDDALANQGVLGFDYPIEGGVVGNWSDLERIWDHVFTYELALNPADHPVLLTEISTTPRHQREKYFEVLFERFHVPAVFLVNQAVLALHASGCTSGVVLSSGSGITEVVPIYEGFCMTHAVTVLDVAGRQVTGQLASLLQHNKGYNFTTSSEWEILRIMKERLAFVASDIEEEKRRSRVVEAHEYKLPDGQTMSVSDELFMCTEPMFQPERAGITDSPGIHSLVMESLQRCDPEIRAMLKDMLILAGGNTKLRGFVPRLQKELAGLNLNMYVNAPSEREHSSWVGGSILASHSSFMDRWVTMEEYADQGSEIVHRKCF